MEMWADAFTNLAMVRMVAKSNNAIWLSLEELNEKGFEELKEFSG